WRTDLICDRRPEAMVDPLFAASPLRASLEEWKAEQRRGWGRGQPRSLAAYLEQTPLGQHPPAFLEMRYNKVLRCEHPGRTPPPEEYVERFPHLKHEIELQFQAHAFLSTAARPAQDTAEAGSTSPGRSPSDTFTGPSLPPPPAAPLLPSVPGYEVLE